MTPEAEITLKTRLNKALLATSAAPPHIEAARKVLIRCAGSIGVEMDRSIALNNLRRLYPDASLTSLITMTMPYMHKKTVFSTTKKAA